MSNSTSSPRYHIVVVVLGDVGRSPRIQYHVRSLLEHGHFVSLVGYEGEELIPDLQKHKKLDSKNTSSTNSTSDTESLLNVVRFKPFSPPASLRKYKLLKKLPIGLPFYLLLRLLGILFGLIYALWFRVPKIKRAASKANYTSLPVDCILAQNPPSIPLLLIAYIYCITQTRIVRISSSTSSTSITTKNKWKICRPAFIIDWHNLGYTMFEEMTQNHPIKLFAKYYEKIIGPLADGNLCVTHSMKQWLTGKENFGLSTNKIKVLHDRPPEFFHSTSIDDQHKLMMKLKDEMEHVYTRLNKLQCDDDNNNDSGNVGNHSTSTSTQDSDYSTRSNNNLEEEIQEKTLLTEIIIKDGVSKRIISRKDRPVVIISSTSWTPDEDFSILLNALVQLNTQMENNQKETEASSTSSMSSRQQQPHILVIVTGKGPQKEMYKAKIEKLQLKHITIITMWLDAADYPILLGCADLGVSLHTSTSGLDLPMKIYDMFGCEVPVCAVNFPCLDELVQHGSNGYVFESSAQLSHQINDLVNFSSGGGGGYGTRRKRDEDGLLDGKLQLFRENIKGMTRWRENWIDNAYDLILDVCPEREEECNYENMKKES